MGVGKGRDRKVSFVLTLGPRIFPPLKCVHTTCKERQASGRELSPACVASIWQTRRKESVESSSDAAFIINDPRQRPVFYPI